jgi:large-conductance mechanosensitive channel
LENEVLAFIIMFQYLIAILEDFGNFLKTRNVINAGIAFIIALQVNKLFTDLINLIVNPIASKVISQEINKQEYKLYGIDFKTGQLFLSFLNFIIVMIFIYYLFKMSEAAPTLFQNFYSKFTNVFSKSK